MYNPHFIFIFVKQSKTKHMKNLITILFLVVSLASFSQTSEREVKMVNEINAVRTNPSSYIPKIEKYIVMCEKKLQMIEAGKLKASSSNGLSGADLINDNIVTAKGLIEVLKNTPSLPELTVNVDMYLVTKAHGEYLLANNSDSHYDENGTLAPERMKDLNVTNVTENIVNDNGMITPTVVLLLVDAGIKGFGHRNNILNPDSRFISVYTNGDTWVQNFAK